MPAEERKLAKSMLEAIILKNQVAGAVRQLSTTSTATTAKKKAASKKKTAKGEKEKA